MDEGRNAKAQLICSLCSKVFEKREFACEMLTFDFNRSVQIRRSRDMDIIAGRDLLVRELHAVDRASPVLRQRQGVIRRSLNARGAKQKS